jgi:anti-anti-sigma factor
MNLALARYSMLRDNSYQLGELSRRAQLMKLVSTIKESDDEAQVALSGSLVYENSAEGRNILEGVLKRRPGNLVIDLRKVNRVSSDWIAAFIRVNQRIKSWNGKVSLVNCSPLIYDTLDVCDLPHLMNVERNNTPVGRTEETAEQVRRLTTMLVSKGVLSTDEAEGICGRPPFADAPADSAASGSPAD